MKTINTALLLLLVPKNTKKLFLLALITFVFASCQQNDKRYTQQSTEIDVVKATINYYDYQKWDSMVMNYADTAKVYYNTRDIFFNAESLPEYHIKNDSTFLTRAFEDDRREYEMITDDNGNKWVNFWGIWEGNLLDNNQKIQIPVHITYQFIDSKIVLEYGYWNSSELTLALQEIEKTKEQDSLIID
ncbi:hypothetical protein FBALC1_12642 [Flavobacteriales bacterium ALC-1]|nr:hypothetical protein FBALC1_12642 [Flavobacteriales bacterium ALC-1]